MALDRFFGLGYRKVSARRDDKDTVGCAFLTKFGFREEGTLLKDSVVEGASRNVVLFAITNSEWTPMMGSSTDSSCVRDRLFASIYGKVAFANEKSIRSKEAEDEANDETRRRLKEADKKKKE